MILDSFLFILALFPKYLYQYQNMKKILDKIIRNFNVPFNVLIQLQKNAHVPSVIIIII